MSLVTRYVGIRKIPSSNSGMNISNEFKVNFPTHYNKEEKVFLLNFYNKLANTSDDKIIELINKERNSFRSTNFSTNFNNEVDLIYFTTESSAKTIQELKYGESEILLRKTGGGFWDCIRKKVTGTDVGKALVLGFVTGAVAGAKIGAVGGTVALPGIGTATGVVGGAVFGGTYGAVGGVAGAYVWPAINCIMTPQKLEEKYLTDDFFINEMPFSRFTAEEIETWNSILNTQELVTFTE